MKEIFAAPMMAERLESLKAGVIGGFSLFLAWLMTCLLNHLVLARYFELFASLQVEVNWHWLGSGAIAAFSGLLFGVTYRYIIREDQNPQLKAGGVLAFGLVRGLAQVDVGWSLPVAVLAAESILWFIVAAIALDKAMQFGLVKPFSSI